MSKMSHVDSGALHEYLDGELDERQRAEIENHVAGCAECQVRLEEARRVSGQASGLLAELEPGPAGAPSWREIEERGAAQRPVSGVRFWARPGLAWAASIAFAFAVGWASSNYWGVGVSVEPALMVGRPDRLSSTEVEPLQPLSEAEVSSEPARAATAAAKSGIGQDESGAADLRNRAGRLDAKAELNEAPREQAPAPTESRRAAHLDQEEDAIIPAAGAVDKAAAVSTISDSARQDGMVRARAEREKVADRELFEAQLAEGAAPTEAESIDSPLRDGTAGARAFAVAVAADEAMSNALSTPAARFFSVQPQEAADWLGAELRTLPDLRLQRVEIGPGSAFAGGVSGRPAVRLVYADAASHEIILVQQLRGSDFGFDDDRGTLPALVISPSGQTAYRWSDDDGYLLALVATLSSDSLRALADRVR